MLQLVLDLKCGYEHKYIVLKDYAYDLSFLANKNFFKKLEYFDTNKKLKFKYQTEKELFDKYKDNPLQLLRDYNLGNVVVSIISNLISATYFPEAFDKKNSPLVFPELFVIGGYYLELDDSESDLKKDNNVVNSFLDSMLYLSDLESSDAFSEDDDFEDPDLEDIGKA